MSNMGDALRKAGLASHKAARQAKHQKRVERKELGKEGLAAQRERRDAEHCAEQAARKQADQAHEKERRRTQAAESEQTRLMSLLREADLMAREAGPRRFYFAMPDGQIHFLEVSPQLAKRLAQGDAAIIDARGQLAADFTAVSGKAAHELRSLAPERILAWNVPA